MTGRRYHLDLAEPLFTVPPPERLRPLTKSEIDELAGSLRAAGIALRGYDDAVGDRLTPIQTLASPWWPLLRNQLLLRQFDADWLDEEVGSCLEADFTLSLTAEPGIRRPPEWLLLLMLQIARQVDPAALAATIADHIAGLSRPRTNSLVAALNCVAAFHPLGAPHQIAANLGELIGMEQMIEPDDDRGVEGYWAGGAPPEVPWQTAAVTPQIAEMPATGPEARCWLPTYERLLSEIGELAIVLQERLEAIIAAREQVERLAHEVNYLAGVDGMAALPQHAALLALADPLALLGRILDGLHAELDPLREQLVGSLAGVLGCLDATWRTPRPREADELAFALDDALAPVYRVAEGRQAEADVKAVQEALAIALREPEIVKAIGASDDPDCARLTDWLRSVYRPAIERGDQRIRVPNSLVELRALLYRAIAAAQTASERRRADALEDELGMLKARAEVLIKSLDQTFEGRALPLSVRFAVAKLEELIRGLRLTSTLRSGRPRPGGVTTGVGHWMGETVPLRAPTAAGNGT